MNLRTEKYYPIACSVVILGALGMLIQYTSFKMPSSENMLSSLASLGGVFAGFIATAKTILLGLRERVRLRLVNSKYILDIRRYFTEALWVSLALCVMSVIGFVPVLKVTPSYVALLFALLAYSLACLHRIARIAMNLLMSG